MPVLPFHKYIGPGNPSDNGPPVDEDDRIAKQHDHNYDRARTAEDVRVADLKAIASFRKNWLVDGNWHSLIGDIGLSLKYLIESYTGVIYPDVDEIVNENDECRIIVVNNFLKLHCVFKRKPLLEKYKTNPFLNCDNRIQFPTIVRQLLLDEMNFISIIPPSLYVPLNWSEIYSKSQDNNLFIDEFEEKLRNLSFNKKFAKDSMKIITKYLELLFLINRKATDKVVKNDKNDILSLINSGSAFIDQDGNIHNEIF